MNENQWSSEDIPLDMPNPSRMYDFFLGGYHNFAIDRAAAEQMRNVMPDAPLFMRANRAFLRRAVTFLVEQGIDQFLDLGSGIPTVGNVHEVAQQLNPDARIVYVDNEPIAVRHSEAILQGHPNVGVIQADIRQPDLILSHPKVTSLIDFSRPVGVLLIAVLHFVTDDASALTTLQSMRNAVAPGSYLAITHATHEVSSAEERERGTQVYARTSAPVKTRSLVEISEFFTGLDLVEPGLVYVPLWRPEGVDDIFFDEPERARILGGVGRVH